LFGEGYQYLPYFVLAVPEIGRIGVGPGRGQFDLHAIRAIDPVAGHEELVLLPGENVVRVPDVHVEWWQVRSLADEWLAKLGTDGEVQIEFLTPTRLIESKKTVKAPDFGIFFRRLLERIDRLGQQFAGHEKRPKSEIKEVYTLADQVRMVEADVRWEDLKGWSGRRHNQTPMGGFVGRAVYRTHDWGPFLPWLILGQGTQAGKLTVKGNGVYQIHMPGKKGYWEVVQGIHTRVNG